MTLGGNTKNPPLGLGGPPEEVPTNVIRESKSQPMELHVSRRVRAERPSKAVVREDPDVSGPVFHELATQKECKIVEGHMVQDHVHMVIDIPPKHSVAQIIGYVKGKSAISVARQFGGRQRNFNGEKFWARGYAVSTVGFEKEEVRNYVRAQEQLDGHDGADEDGTF